MRYTYKGKPVDAVEWNPSDKHDNITLLVDREAQSFSRIHYINGGAQCHECQESGLVHGVYRAEGEFLLCPGDMIVTNDKGVISRVSHLAWDLDQEEQNDKPSTDGDDQAADQGEADSNLSGSDGAAGSVSDDGNEGGSGAAEVYDGAASTGENVSE